MKWNHVVRQVNTFAAVWGEDLSGSLQFSALGVKTRLQVCVSRFLTETLG